jgi:hypothetical protein
MNRSGCVYYDICLGKDCACELSDHIEIDPKVKQRLIEEYKDAVDTGFIYDAVDTELVYKDTDSTFVFAVRKKKG